MEIQQLRYRFDQLNPLEGQVSTLKLEVSDKESKLHQSELDIERYLRKIAQLEKDCEDFKTRLRNKESQYLELENESRRLLSTIDNEKARLLEENQRMGFILDDRLKEIEQKSWLNEKLLMRNALFCIELDRLHKKKATQWKTSTDQEQPKISSRNLTPRPQSSNSYKVKPSNPSKEGVAYAKIDLNDFKSF